MKIEVFNSYILRSPILPFSNISTVPHVYEDLCKFLYAVFDERTMNEALLLASTLHKEYTRLRKQKRDPGRGEKKVIHALLKYYLRSSFRCTPFGYFAGNSIGEFRSSTQVSLASPDKLHHVVHYQNDWLLGVLGLTKDNVPGTSLQFYANPTYYLVREQLRYLEHYDEGADRKFRLVDVDKSDELLFTLSITQQGLSYEELVIRLHKKSGLPANAIENYVNELIKSRLLISELERTDRTALEILAKKFGKKGKEKILLDTLHTLKKQYEHKEITLSNLLEQLNQKSITKTKELPILVNSYFKTGHNYLNTSLLDELKDSIELLKQFSASEDHQDLIRFKEVFVRRYETSGVPLLEALDPETGIGYPVGKIYQDSPHFVKELRPVASVGDAGKLDVLSAKKQGLYIDWLRKGSAQIELTKKDLEGNWQDKRKLPTSFFSLVQILAQSTDDVDKGDFQLIHQATVGPPSTRLFSRFSLDNDIYSELLKTITKEEERILTGVILAEINHLPNEKHRKYVNRRSFLEWEIPIATPPTKDSIHSIRLNRLYIRVLDNELVLYDSETKKRIIPRLTSAYNHLLSDLPVFRFLCDIQSQGIYEELYWDWGHLQDEKSLPRVIFQKVILSPATWNIWYKSMDGSNFIKSFDNYKKEYKIPRQVILVSSDNRLPLDLDNPIFYEIIESAMKRHHKIVLEENLWTGQDGVLKNGEGTYTNEFVIPCLNRDKADHPAPLPVHELDSAFLDREKIRPFDGWVYVKLYANTINGNRILLDVVKPLVKKLRSGKHLETWFFIRYTDEDGDHLRVRFKTDSPGLTIEAINQSCEEYFTMNIIWKITYDTYVKELDRYGAANMINSEFIFQYQSELVLALVAYNLDVKAKDWILCIRAVDEIFSCAAVSLEDRLTIISGLNNAFSAEFNWKKDEKQKLGLIYRQHNKNISDLLSHPDAELNAIMNTYRMKTTGNFEKLSSLKVNVEYILPDYIHMFINRFFSSEQRLYEAVVYDILNLQYKSLLARKRNALIKD